MTTLPHPSAGAAHRQASEEGQILVLTVVVALALLAILGLVADGGLVLARHRELQGVADAAAPRRRRPTRRGQLPGQQRPHRCPQPCPGSHGGRAVPANGQVQRAGQHHRHPPPGHDRAI